MEKTARFFLSLIFVCFFNWVMQKKIIWTFYFWLGALINKIERENFEISRFSSDKSTTYQTDNSFSFNSCINICKYVHYT